MKPYHLDNDPGIERRKLRFIFLKSLYLYIFRFDL